MNALSNAIKNIEYKRQNALKKAEEIKSKLLKNKDYLAIENMLGGLDFERAKREVYGQDITDIDKEIAKVCDEKRHLLSVLGFSESDLIPQFSCNKCNDTGRCDKGRCDCVEKERIRLELINNPDLEKVPNTLKKIDFAVYGEYAEKYRIRAKYLKENIVEKKGNKSIFTIFGEAGTGKTYMSKVCLRQCMENGDTVISLNAIKLNKLFLEYHCAYLENKKEILSEVENCAVLLIDDLGVEQVLNNVTLPYFLQLLIERIGKKTIITTNLCQKDIENRYDQRIFSRLMDKENSAMIDLCGRDLRF